MNKLTLNDNRFHTVLPCSDSVLKPYFPLNSLLLTYGKDIILLLSNHNVITNPDNEICLIMVGR